MTPSRAVSSVISVITMVIITVIMATIVSTFAFGFTTALDAPAPVVSETSSEFVPGAAEQEVLITHVAGDSVSVENMEIVVRATGPGVDTETRLINLPAENSDLDSVNIEGDSGIVAEGTGSKGASDPNQVVIEDSPTDNNRWEAGETIQFEINVGGADFREPSGRTGPEANELEIVVIYTDEESSAILAAEKFSP